MTEGMTEGEIAQLVNRYIGVVDGYLGVPECFSYRTHAEFYSEYCDLSVTMQEGGTTRLKFIATIAALPPRDQAKVLRGVKDRFPPGEEGGPLSRPAMAPKLAEWIERLESTPLVGRANLRISKEVVSKALADADALVASGRPLGARFGPIRPLISVESGHWFRFKPATRFGVFGHSRLRGLKH
jgi:hypothetical protein